MDDRRPSSMHPGAAQGGRGNATEMDDRRPSSMHPGAVQGGRGNATEMDDRRPSSMHPGAVAQGGRGNATEMDDHKHCMKCGAALSADDIGIYMKMVSRNADRFLCMTCLAQRLHCGREALEERVRYYRESGNCVLFR